jgi:hypothetical protein
MKQVKRSVAVVRRSIALPRDLVNEVTSVAPAALRQNFNRLVCTALQEFAEVQRARSFERAMAEMAADPQIRAECAAIEREFAKFEMDGLGDD